MVGFVGFWIPPPPTRDSQLLYHLRTSPPTSPFLNCSPPWAASCAVRLIPRCHKTPAYESTRGRLGVTTRDRNQLCEFIGQFFSDVKRLGGMTLPRGALVKVVCGSLLGPWEGDNVERLGIGVGVRCFVKLERNWIISAGSV